MEEIKENEYIRTTQGTIARIEDTEFDICYNTFNQLLYKTWIMSECFYEEIIKHSSNIIDLIEVGDYVNGYRVEKVSTETNEVLLDHNGFGWRTLKDGDKIVTYEQFASIEYKVEEG